MVTRRVRSEYMKKFKDPKWDTYHKCYEEMLAYRLTRRLLEHTHNPWFWSGSDTDSDSGGHSPPSPSKNRIGTKASREGAELQLEECEEPRRDIQQMQDQQTRTTEAVTRLSLQHEDENGSAVHGLHPDGTRGSNVPEGEEEQQKVCSRASKWSTRPLRDRDTGGPPSQKTKPSRSTKQTHHLQQVRASPLQQPREDTKESRHPFALYGCGEKDADISGRKTHNVCAAASTSEIHESALRAKTRREVERQIQSQRTERRRAKSADPSKVRKLVQPEFNPWLTEYMRCFSARTR
uniref:Centriole, cilia and spindle-associated protein b n=1 Tax=Nothobranchius kuhntae TaxID=321403 RepID=A0A1A8KMA6_NOTKU